MSKFKTKKLLKLLATLTLGAAMATTAFMAVGCGGDENEGDNNGDNQGTNQGGNQGGENQGGENQGGENQGGENQGGEQTVTFTITLNANGGSGSPATVTTDGDGKLAAPTAPTKTGMIFGGWYKEDTLTNKVDFATETFTADGTLFAKWYTPYEYYTAEYGAYTELYKSAYGSEYTEVPYYDVNNFIELFMQGKLPEDNVFGSVGGTLAGWDGEGYYNPDAPATDEGNTPATQAEGDEEGGAEGGTEGGTEGGSEENPEPAAPTAPEKGNYVYIKDGKLTALDTTGLTTYANVALFDLSTLEGMENMTEEKFMEATTDFMMSMPMLNTVTFYAKVSTSTTAGSWSIFKVLGFDGEAGLTDLIQVRSTSAGKLGLTVGSTVSANTITHTEKTPVEIIINVDTLHGTVSAWLNGVEMLFGTGENQKNYAELPEGTAFIAGAQTMTAGTASRNVYLEQLEIRSQEAENFNQAIIDMLDEVNTAHGAYANYTHSFTEEEATAIKAAINEALEGSPYEDFLPEDLQLTTTGAFLETFYNLIVSQLSTNDQLGKVEKVSMVSGYEMLFYVVRSDAYYTFCEYIDDLESQLDALKTSADYLATKALADNGDPEAAAKIQQADDIIQNGKVYLEQYKEYSDDYLEQAKGYADETFAYAKKQVRNQISQPNVNVKYFVKEQNIYQYTSFEGFDGENVNEVKVYCQAYQKQSDWFKVLTFEEDGETPATWEDTAYVFGETWELPEGEDELALTLIKVVTYKTNEDLQADVTANGTLTFAADTTATNDKYEYTDDNDVTKEVTTWVDNALYKLQTVDIKGASDVAAITAVKSGTTKYNYSYGLKSANVQAGADNNNEELPYLFTANADVKLTLTVGMASSDYSSKRTGSVCYKINEDGEEQTLQASEMPTGAITPEGKITVQLHQGETLKLYISGPNSGARLWLLEVNAEYGEYFANATVNYYAKDSSGEWQLVETVDQNSLLPVTAIDDPTDPTGQGRTLSGWYANEDYDGDPYVFGSQIAPAATLNLYAKYAEPDVTVTVYTTTNGTTHTAEADTQEALSGKTKFSELTLPTAGEIEGFRFMGWYTTSDTTGTKLTSDTVLDTALLSGDEGAYTLGVYAVYKAVQFETVYTADLTQAIAAGTIEFKKGDVEYGSLVITGTTIAAETGKNLNGVKQSNNLKFASTSKSKTYEFKVKAGEKIKLVMLLTADGDTNTKTLGVSASASTSVTSAELEKDDITGTTGDNIEYVFDNSSGTADKSFYLLASGAIRIFSLVVQAETLVA